MLFIVNKHILRKGFVGVTLWPFIVMKHKDLKKDTTFINHERIHLRQQLELLILPFFMWYFIEYLIRLVQYRDRYQAYRHISFEREAYSKEDDLGYLKKRKLYSFLKYV